MSFIHGDGLQDVVITGGFKQNCSFLLPNYICRNLSILNNLSWDPPLELGTRVLCGRKALFIFNNMLLLPYNVCQLFCIVLLLSYGVWVMTFGLMILIWISNAIFRFLSDFLISKFEKISFIGENGTIDGQGAIWWNMWRQRTLPFTRPNLIEFMNSRSIIISNVIFQNSPFWNIHPVYCR